MQRWRLQADSRELWERKNFDVCFVMALKEEATYLDIQLQRWKNTAKCLSLDVSHNYTNLFG